MMWFNKDGHFAKGAKIEIRRCPMQNPKRRQYTAEFRHEAVRLVTEHGYGVTEAARNLGINAKMLGRWKHQIEHQNNGVSRGKGQLSVDHDELLRLRKAVKRLRMEREILKKAALFFANESR
jgi:transposase